MRGPHFSVFVKQRVAEGAAGMEESIADGPQGRSTLKGLFGSGAITISTYSASAKGSGADPSPAAQDDTLVP